MMSKRKDRITRRRRKERLKTGLIAIIGILGVSAIAYALIRPSVDEDAPVVANEKSKGDLNAPVLVEEYGDFQ